MLDSCDGRSHRGRVQAGRQLDLDSRALCPCEDRRVRRAGRGMMGGRDAFPSVYFGGEKGRSGHNGREDRNTRRERCLLCLCLEPVEHHEGWLGFRETNSGVYLGRDSHEGFRAWAIEHKGWEQFDARRRPDGDYQLLSIIWWDRKRMAADMETQRVVELAESADEVGAAMRWDLVQV